MRDRTPQDQRRNLPSFADFSQLCHDYFVTKAELADAIAVPPHGQEGHGLAEAQSLRHAYDAYVQAVISHLKSQDKYGKQFIQAKGMPYDKFLKAAGGSKTAASLKALQNGHLNAQEARLMLDGVEQHLHQHINGWESSQRVAATSETTHKLEAARAALEAANTAYYLATLPYKIYMADVIADENEIYLKNRLHDEKLTSRVSRLDGRVIRHADAIPSAATLLAGMSETDATAARYVACMAGVYQLLGAADIMRPFQHAPNYMEQLPSSNRGLLSYEPRHDSGTGSKLTAEGQKTAMALHPYALGAAASDAIPAIEAHDDIEPNNAKMLQLLLEKADGYRLALLGAGMGVSQMEALANRTLPTLVVRQKQSEENLRHANYGSNRELRTLVPACGYLKDTGVLTQQELASLGLDEVLMQAIRKACKQPEHTVA